LVVEWLFNSLITLHTLSPITGNKTLKQYDVN